MHIALAAVHYHADVVDGVPLGIVPHIDVVSGWLYVRVAAKGAWKYIKNIFLSAGSRLTDYLAQALGDIVSCAADSPTLPVHRTRYRFKVFGDSDELDGVYDDRIAMRAMDTVTIISIKHLPVHSLSRQSDLRACMSYSCSTKHAKRGKMAGCSASRPNRRSR